MHRMCTEYLDPGEFGLIDWPDVTLKRATVSNILKSIILLFILLVTTRVVIRKFQPISLLLPSSFFSSAVYASDNTLLRLSLSSDQKYRLFTPINQIPVSVKNLTLQKEDKYFYYHFGVNPISIIKGAISTFLHGQVIGGSTITMQLARLRYDLKTRTVLGKCKQMLAAFFIELVSSKDEILEAYLNLAPYGRNIEGVGAASLLYYKTDVANLLPPQMQKLVQLPQSPSRRGKQVFPQIPELPFLAPHYVEKILKSHPGEDRIRTTLDLNLQRQTEHQLSAFVERMHSQGVKNGMVLITDAQTMAVQAYVGSANFFDPKIAGQVDGITAKRSPGSSLKPFIYALAATKGFIHAKSILIDTAMSKSAYNPENFEKNFIGPISATDALIHSRNIPAISLLNRLTPEYFRSFLLDASISKVRDVDFYGLSMALGGIEVSMEELSSLYGILARLGLPPHTSTKTAKPSAYISRDAAFLILKMLSENPRPESMHKSLQPPSIPIPWKTGTSFGFRDAWATAIYGDQIISVWFGNFDGSSNPVFVGRNLAGEFLFTLVDSLPLPHSARSWYLQTNNVKPVSVCPISGEIPTANCLHHVTSLFIPGTSSIKQCSVHRANAELWNSDVTKLFKDAGLPRANSSIGVKTKQSSIPLISSPQSSLTYIVAAASNTTTEGDDTIPFSVTLDGAAKKAYWFVNDEPVAVVRAGETYFWPANQHAGTFTVRVVDDLGQANSVVMVVESAPSRAR